MAWLDENIPADDSQCGLAHGGFCIYDTLVHATDPQCLPVLDREPSAIGHPYADLTAVIMQWSMPGKSRRGHKRR